MWIAKIKLFHETCIWSPGTKKCNMIDLFYKISEYKSGNHYYLVAAHILQGPEKNNQDYITFIKKDKRVCKAEVHGNFMITLARIKDKGDLKEYHAIYNPAIFHIKPVIVKEGYEYWEVGCWEKAPLMEFIHVAIKRMHGELFYIHQHPLEDLQLPHLMPKLTKKQRRAIDLAIENGYYNIPRRIELKELAARMGVSLPTYQEHLRKAELNIIPNLIKLKP